MTQHNILVIGGTGFTGEHVVKVLLKQANTHIRLLVRSIEKATQLGFNNMSRISLVEGNLDTIEQDHHIFKSQDVVICTASLGFGHTENLVLSLEKYPLKKVVFISTTGIFTKLNPKSKQVRLSAEKYIQNSTLNYTIIRPTMIYGTQKDRNMCRLIRFIKKMPIIPIFGPGTFLQQPIYVQDLAQVIVTSAFSNNADRKTYNVSGKQALSYNDIITQIKTILNTVCIPIHIPYWLSLILGHFLEGIMRNPPVKVEQIKRLNEHKNFSYTAAIQDLNFTPCSFEEGISREIKEVNK